MSFSLYEESLDRVRLLPLTYTRPISELRLGILSIREKWESYLESFQGYVTEEYLFPKFRKAENKPSLHIRSNVLPSDQLVTELTQLRLGCVLKKESQFIGFHGTHDQLLNGHLEIAECQSEPIFVIRPWNFISFIENEVKRDIELIRNRRSSQSITDKHTIVYGDDLFVEEGAIIRNASINTLTGPVYLGKNCVINEGSIIQGPFVLGDGSELNLGAKIRSNVVVGPNCKVGGEVGKSIIQGYSNKAHDGYLGNSFIGEWCNIGADTNTSNMKNNYTNVRVWDYETESYMDSEKQFVGMTMGDHSKCGINTMFNTGSVVGFSSSVFGGGFPEKHIPSFSWGGQTGNMEEFSFEKALSTAEIVMKRRNVSLSEVDRSIFTSIFESTKHLRSIK